MVEARARRSAYALRSHRVKVYPPPVLRKAAVVGILLLKPIQRAVAHQLNEESEPVPMSEVGETVVFIPGPDPLARLYLPPVKPRPNKLRAGIFDEPKVAFPIIGMMVGRTIVLGAEKHLKPPKQFARGPPRE